MKATKWLALLVAALQGAATVAAQHNILLIIGDDIGIDSSRLYNKDVTASFPPVPNIESLARGGVLFSNAYACPTCSPSRSAILTGRYGWRTGVLSAESSDNLSADEYTLPEVIADQPGLSYASASVGKWHLGGGDTGPNVLGGWSHFAGTLGGAVPDYRNWNKTVNGVTSNETTYVTRENVTDAIDWIDDQGTTNWIMWVGFNAGHTPLHKPPDQFHSYDYLSGTSEDIATNARPYFEAMIEAMDFQIGRLISSVDTNETTIIFLGDNGTDRNVIQPPYDMNGRAKGSLYEGGTHVPMFIAGPDVVNPGRTNDAVVHCVDLFATIIELTGGTVPASTGQDSRSLVPILEDSTFQPSEDCILMESDDLLGGTTTGRAIRNDRYKLIQIAGSSDRLYDMDLDPMEGTNLLESTLTAPEQAEYDALSEKLASWKDSPIVEIPTNGYPVADTAQPDCYDTNDVISTPAPGESYAGQDAQYAGNQPSYTVSDDGLTVQDNVTGLVWQWSPDVDGNGIINAGDELVWTQLWDHAESLNATNFGGYNDWRIPTTKELYSLIDFRGLDPRTTATNTSQQTPFIDTEAFHFAYGDIDSGERIIDAQYWTQTESVYPTMTDSESFFGVNFADGRIKGYPRDGISFDAYLRCVRGNAEYGTNLFINNGDGTVTDHATGLMWQQGDSGSGTNWHDALAYAENLELAGYRDWRLPNAKELQSIVDYTRSPDATDSGAIDPEFTCTAITNEDGVEDYPFYWTGTTHLKKTSGAPHAVYVAFGRGLGFFQNRWQDVHGAGCQRSDPKDGDPDYYPSYGGPQGDVLRVFNFVRCVRAGATPSETDTDSDGLCDWYEYDYSGSITNLDPAADDDGDGFNNGSENEAGTIPTLDTSLLQVTDLASASNGMVVYWSSELGRTYAVSTSTNLIEDAFSSVVASNLPATPPSNEYTDESATVSNRFYRIEVE